MTTQNTRTEIIVSEARRYTAGLALLSNADYTFTPFASEPQAFYVEKGDGTIYLTSVKTWSCSCPDFEKNKKACKHVFACEELTKQSAQLAQYDANEESGRDEYPL